MDDETLSFLRGLATLFAMIAFIGVWAWAWGRHRQKRFDDAAKLPLEEDPP